MAKTTNRLQEYARLGAAVRRAQLVEELRAIDKAFPGMRFQKRPTATPDTTDDEPVTHKRRKRRKLTPAEKEFISERMKKYWAARKKKES